MLSRIKDRKVVQWVAAYAVAAWVSVQVVGEVSDGFAWSATPLRVTIILGLVGAPIVAVLGWYHGEKGRQRVNRDEAFVLGAISAMGLVVLVAFGNPPPAIGGDGERDHRALQLDSSIYAVLPFRKDGQGADSADLYEDILLYDALGRWEGIQVLDPSLVRERVRATSQSGRRSGESSESAVAIGLGAGRYITGEVISLATGLRFRAAVHDSRTSALLADTTVVLASPGEFVDSVARAVAHRLLFAGRGLEIEDGPDAATTSVEARRAFLAGREAQLNWDLDEAERQFRRAIAADPGYVRGHLWLAQVRNWNGEDPPRLARSATIAVAGAATLPKAERDMALALELLAGQRYPEACAAYEAMIEAHPRDFAAWFGAGECRARDRLVIATAGRPSGLAFRGSYHRAVEAYRRAYGLLPTTRRGFSSRSFERMSQVLFLTTNRYRHGVGEGPDPRSYGAWPTIIADTLAFVPDEISVFRASGARDPHAHWDAVEAHRRIFLEIATAWSAAFPQSVDAQISLALAYEQLADPRSLEILRRARSMADVPQDRVVTLMSEEVKQLVKQGRVGDFARANALADSALALVPADESRFSEDAVLAGLTGRLRTAVAASRSRFRAVDHPVRIPAAVTATAEALQTFAAFGGPRDSILTVERQLREMVANQVSARVADEARHYLLDRTASLSLTGYPLAGAVELAGSSLYPLLQAQGAHAAGDLGRAREILAGVRAQRRLHRPAELAPEAVFAEAWLWAALGDTTTAMLVLDSTLEALPWLEPGALSDVPRAVSLVRAMALRADLAAAAGDRVMAARWGGAVAALWAGADPYLQPVVRRMTSLSRFSMQADR